MADLPQSWRADNEAQPLISCFELLVQLALLVWRWRSPLPVSGRISLRQGSDHVTAGAAIMTRFETAQPLQRFVQVIARWATISSGKLEVDYIQGIDKRVGRHTQSQQGIHQGFFPARTAHRILCE